MTTQIVFQTAVAGLVLWITGIVWYSLEKSTDYERFVLVELVEASFKVDAAAGTNDPVLFRTPVGKLIIKMLDGIRNTGKRAIVYDTAGTFVEKFYRPEVDTPLNPLDPRTAPWSPGSTSRGTITTIIAESTVPDKAGDPFWEGRARHSRCRDAEAGEAEAYLRIASSPSPNAIEASRPRNIRDRDRCCRFHLD